MSRIRGTGAEPVAATDARPSRPHLREVLVRVAANVITAVLVPALLLWATLTLLNFTTAVVVALAWMAGAMVWRWATRRPVSGLLLLTLAVLAIRTTLALITGSTFFYFIQPVFSDLTIAAIFLASLATTRPVVARIAPDFFPMDAATSARPVVRCLFRRLTLMWGVVVLLKAAVTFTLLESLSTPDFVLIKGGAVAVLTISAAVGTVVWAVSVAHREGLIHPRVPAPAI